MFWPLQENVIGDDDLDVLTDFIRETKRFTQFDNVRLFEKNYSEWQGSKYSVYVNSGSSANLILLSAAKELYGWKDGDEVIVPAVTWPTTITPVMQLGLKPVFVDISLQDLALDCEKVIQAITENTKAIFLVHLLGFPADIDKLRQIADEHDLQILEDCCEAMGASASGRKVGCHGVGGTFSFYWGHHMTTVEGGIVCTDDDDLYKLLLLKRSHGLARELPAEFHQEYREKYQDVDFNFLFLTDGFNFRNTELHAVLGVQQLKHIDDYIDIRNRNYEKFYEECLRYADHLHLVRKEGMSSFVLPFMFKDPDKKSEFQALIAARGIESRPIISGNLLRQPFLSAYSGVEVFENAEFIHDHAFYIGNNQFVDDQRLAVLFDLMRDFFNGLD